MFMTGLVCIACVGCRIDRDGLEYRHPDLGCSLVGDRLPESRRSRLQGSSPRGGVVRSIRVDRDLGLDLP